MPMRVRAEYSYNFCFHGKKSYKPEILTATYFLAGECIKCVQCTTLISRECEDGYVPPMECKTGMPYCIKYVGRLKSGKKYLLH